MGHGTPLAYGGLEKTPQLRFTLAPFCKGQDSPNLDAAFHLSFAIKPEASIASELMIPAEAEGVTSSRFAVNNAES